MALARILSELGPALQEEAEKITAPLLREVEALRHKQEASLSEVRALREEVAGQRKAHNEVRAQLERLRQQPEVAAALGQLAQAPEEEGAAAPPTPPPLAQAVEYDTRRPAHEVKATRDQCNKEAGSGERVPPPAEADPLVEKDPWAGGRAKSGAPALLVKAPPHLAAKPPPPQPPQAPQQPRVAAPPPEGQTAKLPVKAPPSQLYARDADEATKAKAPTSASESTQCVDLLGLDATPERKLGTTGLPVKAPPAAVRSSPALDEKAKAPPALMHKAPPAHLVR